MKKIEVRENGTLSVKTIFEDKSRTQQHFKDECDINQIMAKYKRGIQPTHLARSLGVYADLSSVPDYSTALQTVINAQNAFATLPSNIRKKFDHDPQSLLQFIADPKNKDECIQMGILEKKPEMRKNETQNEKTQTKENIENKPTP